MPKAFESEVDFGLIKRAVLSIQSAKRQKKGAKALSGRDYTAEYIGARHYPNMMRSINVGRARRPRLKNRRAVLFGRVAGISGIVGGSKAHPPKVQKILKEKINKKEKKKATLSAIAATADKELVQKRGHIVREALKLPIVVQKDFEEIKKTKKVKEFFKAISIWGDVERAKKRKHIRSGKGKMRGRKYKRRKSILVVTKGKANVWLAARNLEGVDVVELRNLNAELLAPGAVPGRLTVWTEPAIKALGEGN